ncbi:MAG: restriction endonuclease subunit S [Clostridium butyricum]|nr:restriction endonuclease subunit S [Clostridium butyricum]
MISSVEWGEYKIGDLFIVKSYKKRFDANKVTILEEGRFPYIVRMSTNNGQKGFIEEDEKYLNEGNTLTFGQDTATVFYQETPYFTGDKIKILKCKEERFGKNNALFFVTAITRAFSNFSWGTSSYSVDVIENQKIKLPIKNQELDFDFMEAFTAEIEAEHMSELTSYLKADGLDDYVFTKDEQDFVGNVGENLSEIKAMLDDRLKNSKWNEYRIGDLFTKIKTKKLPYKANDLPNKATGQYVLPCLTSSFRNQGLNYYVPKEGATVLKNVISIPSNSDVYRAYFQPREFTVLSDSYAICWKSKDVIVSPNQYLFMVLCINKVTDLPIYSYKNKLGGWNVVKNKKILLPQTNGKIDFDFMEKFVRIMKKLLIKDVVVYAEKKVDATK